MNANANANPISSFNHPVKLSTSDYILNCTDGTRYIMSQSLEALGGLMDFMQKVLYSSGSKTFFETDNAATGSQKQRVSALGKHLHRLPNYGDLYSRHRTFHPLAQFFFEEYRRHPIVEIFPPVLPTDIHRFDDFIRHLRKRAAELGLKKKVSDWDSKTKKNKKRLKRFESELFSRHARLVAIRLDLSYHKASFTPQEISKFLDEDALDRTSGSAVPKADGDCPRLESQEIRVALEEVQRDRERLFANMKGKPSLFKHLVGYVWRIECSPRAGYHIHLALFFDGSRVQHHEWLAQEIGNYWNQLTHGRGRFHNCNLAWKKNAPNYGIGVINHDETEKRHLLVDNVLTYLCKDSQLVQITPHPRCKLFGSGFVHRAKAKKRGRPRREGLPIQAGRRFANESRISKMFLAHARQGLADGDLVHQPVAPTYGRASLGGAR